MLCLSEIPCLFLESDTFKVYNTLYIAATLGFHNYFVHSTARIIDCDYGNCSVGTIIRRSSSYRSSLSRALKRDVSVPLSSLRRSQSLDDLSTFPHHCEYYQSCPDLLEMQSLHNMHPKLHNGLKCDKLYHPKQPGREIKLNSHYRVHQRYEEDYDTFITFIKSSL